MLSTSSITCLLWTGYGDIWAYPEPTMNYRTIGLPLLIIALPSLAPADFINFSASAELAGDLETLGAADNYRVYPDFPTNQTETRTINDPWFPSTFVTSTTALRSESDFATRVDIWEEESVRGYAQTGNIHSSASVMQQFAFELTSPHSLAFASEYTLSGVTVEYLRAGLRVLPEISGSPFLEVMYAEVGSYSRNDQLLLGPGKYVVQFYTSNGATLDPVNGWELNGSSNTHLTMIATSVPEPASILAIAVGTLGLLRRRRHVG
jgi:hypothetical protein